MIFSSVGKNKVSQALSISNQDNGWCPMWGIRYFIRKFAVWISAGQTIVAA